MNKKPRGINGAYRVQAQSDGTAKGEFLKVELPESKEGIEEEIINRFISLQSGVQGGANSEFGNWHYPQKNLENDFDFTVMTQNGKAYVELKEIAPLEGPYETASSKYDIYSFAECVFNLIKKSSGKYDQKMDVDLYLLLYVTNWTFHLSDPVLECVRHWCRNSDLVFREIYLYTCSHGGSVKKIFPIEHEAHNDFDPERYRGSFGINLDPRKFIPLGTSEVEAVERLIRQSEIQKMIYFSIAFDQSGYWEDRLR